MNPDVRWNTALEQLENATNQEFIYQFVENVYQGERAMGQCRLLSHMERLVVTEIKEDLEECIRLLWFVPSLTGGLGGVHSTVQSLDGTPWGPC